MSYPCELFNIRQCEPIGIPDTVDKSEIQILGYDESVTRCLFAFKSGSETKYVIYPRGKVLNEFLLSALEFDRVIFKRYLNRFYMSINHNNL